MNKTEPVKPVLQCAGLRVMGQEVTDHLTPDGLQMDLTVVQFTDGKASVKTFPAPKQVEDPAYPNGKYVGRF